jgi:hypothetical protein
METGAEGARFFVWRKKPSSLFWEHKLMGLRPETIFRGGQQSAKSGRSLWVNLAVEHALNVHP